MTPDAVRRNKARLLVLASTYPRWLGDPEPGFVHELSRRLTARFDVAVLAPHAPKSRRHETMDGVRVFRYRYAPESIETLVSGGGILENLRRSPWKAILLPAFALAQLFAAMQLVRKLRPDVIHAHWLVPQGLTAALIGACMRRPPPIIVTAHGADVFALKGAVMQWLKRFVLRRASAVTAVSRALSEALQTLHTGVDKPLVLPMGVDLSTRFVPDLATKKTDGEILFVGRLVEKKGLRYLLQAMPAILVEHPHATLNVVGFGPERAVLHQLAKDSGISQKIRFLGAQPQIELPAFYRSAQVFVAPFVEASSGDQEGLGLVVIEAIGCNCSVIVSDLPAIRDIIPNIDQGCLVSPGDSEALAKAVGSALSNPNAYEVAASRRKEIVETFDWPVVASRYAELILMLVGRSHSEHAFE